MSKKSIHLLIIGSMATAFALPASAQWYIGGAVGTTRAKISDDVLPISGSTASSLSKDDSTNVYGLGVGYDFTNNWALEGGYANNGKFGARRTSTAGTVGTLGAQSEGSAWHLSGIGKLPLQHQFYLFGKLGAAATTTKTNLDTTGAVVLPVGTSMNRKHTEMNFLWGLGAGYDINPSVGLRLDYTHIQNVGDANTGEGDVQNLMVGVKVRF